MKTTLDDETDVATAAASCCLLPAAIFDVNRGICLRPF